MTLYLHLMRFLFYLIQLFLGIPHIFFLGCCSWSEGIVKIQIVARSRQNLPTRNHGHRTRRSSVLKIAEMKKNGVNMTKKFTFQIHIPKSRRLMYWKFLSAAKVFKNKVYSKIKYSKIEVSYFYDIQNMCVAFSIKVF